MKRGEETIIPNWVFVVVRGLSLASDIKVLLFLAEHHRYQNSTFGPGAISDRTGLDYRTVTASLSRLGKEGHILGATGEHCLRGACATVAHRLHKSTPTRVAEKSRQESKTAPANPEIIAPYRNEGKQREEEQNIPPAPQGGSGADAPMVAGNVPPHVSDWDDADTVLLGAPEGGNGTAADAAPEGDLTPAAVRVEPPATAETAQPTEGQKVPPAAAPAEKPRRTRAAKAAPAVVEIPAALLAVEGFEAAWATWLRYRVESKLASPATTLDFQLRRLEKYLAEGHAPADVIEESITHGWKSVFPPKGPAVLTLQTPPRVSGAPRTTEDAIARAADTSASVLAQLRNRRTS